MYAHDEREPDHATSATGHVVEELELYGYRPSEDEPDPRISPTGVRFRFVDKLHDIDSTVF